MNDCIALALASIDLILRGHAYLERLMNDCIKQALACKSSLAIWFFEAMPISRGWVVDKQALTCKTVIYRKMAMANATRKCHVLSAFTSVKRILDRAKWRIQHISCTFFENVQLISCT
nr:hypothetical protein Iba_chr13cCG16920 [Ipomoea batatas]